MEPAIPVAYVVQEWPGLLCSSGERGLGRMVGADPTSDTRVARCLDAESATLTVSVTIVQWCWSYEQTARAMRCE